MDCDHGWQKRATNVSSAIINDVIIAALNIWVNLAVFAHSQACLAGQALRHHGLAASLGWLRFRLATRSGRMLITILGCSHICSTRKAIHSHCPAANPCWHRAIFASETSFATADAAVCCIHIRGLAMTAAVRGSLARRRHVATGSRPAIRTMALAAVCAVLVKSGMPIAMVLAAASWWNGTILSSEVVRAGAVATIGCIEIIC